MRTLRRLRVRALHAARHHYMLAVTATLLVVAGAAGLGAFTAGPPDLRLDQRVIAVAPTVAAPAPAVPVNAPRPPRLVMTYYIVDSQALMDSLNAVKGELRHREWLEKSAFEVLLVRSPADQVEAQKAIDDARERCVCAEFHVEDLRH
jgi:hypothetical protein